MSHAVTGVTCQHAMNDPVDQLKAALGVETDIALARELGLERSTIAQWRRRGALPALYRGIIDAGERAASLAVALAARQQVYGDSRAMYLLRGALAVIPAGLLDFPELSAHLLGDHRERLLLNVARVVQEVT